MEETNTILLDSNIIIYTGLTNHHDLRAWLKERNTAVSLISQLEVLGYHSLNLKDKIYFESFFGSCQLIPIDSNIINRAIKLRQQKSMSLGDAIVASTAMNLDIALTTANTKDFKHIKNLKVVNPLEI